MSGLLEAPGAPGLFPLSGVLLLVHRNMPCLPSISPRQNAGSPNPQNHHSTLESGLSTQFFRYLAEESPGRAATEPRSRYFAFKTYRASSASRLGQNLEMPQAVRGISRSMVMSRLAQKSRKSFTVSTWRLGELCQE